MRSVSDLIVQSKKAETHGAVVLTVFVLFVATVLALPLSMVWAASNL